MKRRILSITSELLITIFKDHGYIPKDSILIDARILNFRGGTVEFIIQSNSFPDSLEGEKIPLLDGNPISSIHKDLSDAMNTVTEFALKKLGM